LTSTGKSSRAEVGAEVEAAELQAHRQAGDQAAAVEQVVEFKFSGPGPSFQMKNRMEAPKRTMIDDDAPEDMDSFEVEGTGAVVEVNLSLGSSGGTGIKAASQNGSPSKAEKTSI
jgi:hypothetical protein